MQATFRSAQTSTPSVFHVISDESTVESLISSIDTNCSAVLGPGSSMSPTAFDGGPSGAPLPEQAVQYYRASSVVLTLDGYNNTAALSANASTAPATPLPGNVDRALLNCLNYTIGAAVPLFSDSDSVDAVTGAGTAVAPTPLVGVLIGPLYLLWCLSYWL